MINPNITIEDLNKLSQNTLVSHLGIECTEIGKDYICGKMPVDDRTRQPFGLLHGGASVVLAETLGSFGAAACIDLRKQFAVGLEVNANHIKSATTGFVYGKAQILHCGRKTQVWDIKIHNENKALVCASRITMAILDKPEI
ncbi:MAG TPA: hotdog fold thioesterase [Cytophagaceae bacterium]|jgi:1,4-dihydroxy-2-naphthoyl-CoA hydrolase